MSLDADIEVAIGEFVLTAEISAGDGEVVALMGPNGAGKTTLLRALAGLAPVDAGRVVIGGRVVDDAEASVFVAPRERGVGYVFQEPRLFPHLTVLDNVAFARRARQSRSASHTQVEDWIEALALTPFTDRRPAELSGGQRQRVALARALASEPYLLLLDEPTAALDTETRSLIGDLVRATSTTTVLVTHDRDEAERVADAIVTLDGSGHESHAA